MELQQTALICCLDKQLLVNRFYNGALPILQILLDNV